MYSYSTLGENYRFLSDKYDIWPINWTRSFSIVLRNFYDYVDKHVYSAHEVILIRDLCIKLDSGDFSFFNIHDRPVSMASWLKEDGYTMVEGNKSENKHKSVFVNSSRQKFSEDIKLKAVKFQRFANYNRNNGYSRGDHGQCEVFVSRLDPQTTPRNVCQFLRSRFNKSLKVEQIKARFDTYASFKIFAPKYMKRELLNKYNWDDSGDIYVREFITKSASYKSQY